MPALHASISPAVLSKRQDVGGWWRLRNTKSARASAALGGCGEEGGVLKSVGGRRARLMEERRALLLIGEEGGGD